MVINHLLNGMILTSRGEVWLPLGISHEFMEYQCLGFRYQGILYVPWDDPHKYPFVFGDYPHVIGFDLRSLQLPCKARGGEGDLAKVIWGGLGWVG